MIFLHYLLLSLALCCSAEGLQAAAMMTGMAQSAQSDVAPADPSTNQTPAAPPPCPAPQQEAQQEAQWRSEVLALLSQLVSGQREEAGGQAELAKLLSMLGTQGSQQILDLQNVARHQSLLVENHQALLLQVSRIATQLQDMNRKPASQ
ncbi:uncharacterized protein LOC144541807 [Centroberyx gerrardi]